MSVTVEEFDCILVGEVSHFTEETTTGDKGKEKKKYKRVEVQQRNKRGFSKSVQFNVWNGEPVQKGQSFDGVVHVRISRSDNGSVFVNRDAFGDGE